MVMNIYSKREDRPDHAQGLTRKGEWIKGLGLQSKIDDHSYCGSGGLAKQSHCGAKASKSPQKPQDVQSLSVPTA